MNINRSIALLLCLGAIALGAAVVLVPPLFQPDATQFSFYLYVETTPGVYTISSSPLFDLDGHLDQPVEITVMSDETELGTIVYGDWNESVYDFAIYTSNDIAITGAEVTIAEVKWSCNLDTSVVHFSTNTGLSPLIHCTK